MKLLLAVDIADRLHIAALSRKPFDIKGEARALLARHPEAHVSVEDIMATMLAEMQADARKGQSAGVMEFTR